ncbi:MAG: type II secretion system protein [Campylobacter sp.]|nr:type II secretion system protein [Campylobacter sp.]MDY3245496.1 type II secretion system protein [Campylobacter sp.]MDY5383560.1 type II secretion system protein [Campylobacter sp.]
MKKGFTMIELIFVIVILGILASVAIPRLAATREDAEISAAVANLRTLVSDASAYYTAKGSLKSSGDADAKWSEITNVPLGSAASTNATTDANLKIGGVDDCIKVKLENGTPAKIKFTKKDNATGTCGEVLKSDPLQPYFNATDGIPIGSSTSVYTTK